MTAVTETVYQIFHDRKMADKAIQQVPRAIKSGAAETVLS